MSYIISKEEVKRRLVDAQEEILLIDVRFNMGVAEEGRKAYEQAHLPRAVYLDIDEDLSGEVKQHGGAHPLPDVDTLAEKLGNLGIDQNTRLVIYDQNNGMFAARAWWVMRYLGHEHVYVLDGGFKAWGKAGYPVTDEIIAKEPTVFTPQVQGDQAVTMEQVKANIDTKEAVLIDSRANARYLGKEEPLYAKAGHIPGAKNFFWLDIVNEDGTYKEIDALAKHFSSLDKEEEIIVSCGSGISACPNILALQSLGFKNVKLYPGSFSDWISYEDNRLETKEE